MKYPYNIFLKEEFNVSGPIFAGWRRDKRNKWNRAVEQISNKLENKNAERRSISFNAFIDNKTYNSHGKLK